MYWKVPLMNLWWALCSQLMNVLHLMLFISLDFTNEFLENLQSLVWIKKKAFQLVTNWKPFLTQTTLHFLFKLHLVNLALQRRADWSFFLHAADEIFNNTFIRKFGRTSQIVIYHFKKSTLRDDLNLKNYLPRTFLAAKLVLNLKIQHIFWMHLKHFIATLYCDASKSASMLCNCL